MASDDDLRLRETARRQALWAFAGLIPGDPRAVDALVILDDIDRQEQSSPIPSIAATERPGGILTVQDMDIPQPWRERFHCASRGSTRLLERAHWYGWEKFLSEWQKEMSHLERDRCAWTQ